MGHPGVLDKGGQAVTQCPRQVTRPVLSCLWVGARKALSARGWQVGSEAEKAQLWVCLPAIRQLCLVHTRDARLLLFADKTWLIEEAGLVEERI